MQTITASTMRPFDFGDVKLSPSLFRKGAELNRKYVMSLESKALLQNFYIEAGLYDRQANTPEEWGTSHMGWESPACQLRGHFLGHWLSAAAKLYAATGDAEAKGKADWIVSELALCQIRNGGEWIGSIPEKYLHWITEGKQVWAPQYTLHKTLMGLYDMYAFAGSSQALSIIDNWSKWFLRWTDEMSAEQLADVLDVETGGMMEAWADVYSATGKPEHLELMRRYTRHRLFDPILRGEDVLTNMHANTTIPEIHGAARAYEVTGDGRWREIVEAYWRLAVTERDSLATGSQTTGEVWTPQGEISARLGAKNQEHCVVYNMIRLADFLYRWNGDAVYLDYIERNLYNGILAQQHPLTGMITYFLPLQAGARKKWGSPTHDFWCCHGSLVQAHTINANLAYYLNTDADSITVAQYIPSELTWKTEAGLVTIRQQFDSQTNWGIRNPQADKLRRPGNWAINIEIEPDREMEFEVRLRLPGWLSDSATVLVNGKETNMSGENNGYAVIRRVWCPGDRIHIVLPKKLTIVPLPDRPDTVAFLDGPVLLAGLVDEERMLYGDLAHPEELLIPDNEREWAQWLPGYRTAGQERGIQFIPLFEVVDQAYSVYFPVREARVKGH
jgi:DUF1680 family protein